MENPRVLNIPVTLNGLPPNVHLNDTDLRFIQQELVSAMQPYLNKLSSQIISNLGSSSFQQTSTLSSFGSPLPLQVPSESSSQTCNTASTSASSSLLNPLGVKNSLFNSIASVSPSVVSPLVAPLAVPSADSNAASEPLSEPNLSEPAEPITQLTPVDAPSDNTTPASCFSPARTPTPTPSNTPQPASCSYEPLPPVGLLPDVRRSRRKRGPNRLRPFDYSQQSTSANEQHSLADSSASASASACVSPAAQAHAYASLEADAGSDPSASASTMRLTVPVQIDIKLPISIGGLNPLQLFSSAAHAATSGSCVGPNSGSAAVSVGHSSALPSAALFSGAGTNTVSGSGVYAGGETARSSASASASASACASVSATASVISSRCNSRLSNDGPLSVSRMSESRIASRASSIRPDADDATSDMKPFNLKFKTKLPRKPAQQQQQQQPKDMNLEELEAFAHYFKARRIDLGFTQADVGAALGKLYGSEFSQTTVSRFEALRLTFNNMVRLQPLLDTWLSHAVRLQQKGLCVPKLERAAGDAEAGASAGAPLSAAEAVEASIRAENRANRAAAVGEGGEDGEGAEAAASYSGGSDAETASELIDLPGPNRKRKRKRRTTIDGELRMQLEKHYVIEPRPTPSALIAISTQLNVDKEVVRVWFCNRRQRDRRLVDHDMLALNTADPDADAIAAPDAAGSLLSQI